MKAIMASSAERENEWKFSFHHEAVRERLRNVWNQTAKTALYHHRFYARTLTIAVRRTSEQACK